MPFPVVGGLRGIEFGDPGEMRAWLVDLVLLGRKKATAGLWAEYEDEGEPLEHVGERLAVLDDEGTQVATVAVTRIDVVRFADVPDDFALAEGEGDLNGEDFRSSHREYWGAQGQAVTDDTVVVLVRFDLVDAEDATSAQ
jgi:uncharacterized protein YhfF